MGSADPARGMTPRELARVLRIGRARVLTLIRRGELPALDVGTRGRPRYVVMPGDLAEWVRRRRVTAPPQRGPRRRARVGPVDYYPD